MGSSVGPTGRAPRCTARWPRQGSGPTFPSSPDNCLFAQAQLRQPIGLPALPQGCLSSHVGSEAEPTFALL